MAGDYSKIRFVASNNYAGVLKQQGRVSLDSDWNEDEAIQDRRWRSETIDIISRCVVPISTPDAFRVTPTASGEFDIGLGRLYADGLQAENHGLAPDRFDPVLAEPTGTAEVPYTDQPYLPAPLPADLTRPELPPIAGRTDLVYLDVWHREVTAIEDPGLLEIALGGPDTTTRIQTAWQVRVLEDVGDAHCPDPIDAFDSLTEPSAGRLSVSTVVPPPSDNPCIISAAGGYRGLENRLYRVEVHVGGALGTAQFKWSRDNGSVSATVDALNAGRDQITVRHLGRDAVLRFDVGDWVEVLDDHVEFRQEAGHMAQVTAIDEANRILTLDPPIPVTLDIDATDLARHTRVRRWDQSAGVNPNGLLDVVAGPVDIEDGIQVGFAIDPAQPGGEFHVGDYWVFAARTADGSVEALTDAPPRGIHHHYCRLAVVTWGPTPETTRVRDCRTLWPPAHCCDIAVRPGEDIQAAIDRVPAEGGCVCLLPGLHVIDRPLLIDARENLTLMGAGAASKLVYLPAPGAQAHASALYVAGTSRAIRIERILFHAEDLDQLVAVHEGSSHVRITGCGLVCAPAGDQRRGAAVLLGECCDVTIADCRMAAHHGVLQAGPAALASVAAELAAARGTVEEPGGGEGGGEGGGAEQAPPEVPTVRELRIAGNAVWFTRTGVELLDVLGGEAERNRLGGIAFDRLTVFRQPSPQELPVTGEFTEPFAVEAFYDALDDHLDSLAGCIEIEMPVAAGAGGETPSGPIIPDDTFGFTACVLQDYGITDNRVAAGAGVVVRLGRTVYADRNRISAVRVGVALDYAFDAGVRDGAVHIVERDDLSNQAATDDPWRLWRQRYEPGRTGVSVRFTRGFEVLHNEVVAHTAVGVASAPRTECAGVQADSVLRVLGVARAWRITVELAWFVYQFVLMLSAVGTTPPPPPEAGAKAAFERSLFERFVGLLDSGLLGFFVGKARVEDNRMEVSRYGVRFHQILSVGGLRITGNRVSGFREGGILVYPRFSVGLVEDFARWLRCALMWVLTLLDMLRDALTAFLAGEPRDETAPGGLLGIAVQGISLFLTLCARLCGEPPAGGEGGEGGERPRTPADDLRDALDDFLDNVNRAWLDDLVNQSYEIDRNVLAGAGDGIWCGLDGTRITDNQVTIWPDSSAALETMLFGALLARHFSDTEYLTPETEVLAEAAADLDREMLFAALFAGGAFPADFLDQTEFRNRMRAFLAEWGPSVDPASPLAEHLVALNTALAENSLDPVAALAAWARLLFAMVRWMKGYGIVMQGADMECRENVVLARTGCGTRSAFRTSGNIDFQTTAASSTTFRQTAGFQGVAQPLFVGAGIGGIRQVGNVIGLLLDFLVVVLLEQASGVNRTIRLVLALLALLALLLVRERTLRVLGNRVEDALSHGIRTLALTGMDDLEVFDNAVRDAGRHGIYHLDYVFSLADQAMTAKVHRNSVRRGASDEVSRRLGALGAGFASLMRIEAGSVNVDEREAVLMHHNHGEDTLLNGQQRAVRVEAAIVGIMSNYVLTRANLAFEVLTGQGLFTDNLTNRPNQIAPGGVEQAPNINNL